MSSDFLDTLLSGGADYKVSFTSDGASLKPSASTNEALRAFQSVVEKVEANEGYGYHIFKTHESRDRGGDQVDLVLIKFDNGGVSHVEEGKLAFERGTDIVDCPYTYPPFRDAWKAGWFDAEEAKGARGR